LLSDRSVGGCEAACRAGQVLGPDADEWSETRQQLAAYIDVAMGGRVAEELTFGADQARAATQAT
jgi:ATP-dependent Zn protease